MPRNNQKQQTGGQSQTPSAPNANRNAKRNSKRSAPQHAPTTLPQAVKNVAPSNLQHGSGLITEINSSTRTGFVEFLVDKNNKQKQKAEFDLDQEMNLMMPNAGLAVEFDWWRTESGSLTASALRLEATRFKNAILSCGLLHPVPNDDDSIEKPTKVPDNIHRKIAEGCLCHVSIDSPTNVPTIVPRCCIAMSTRDASGVNKGKVFAPGVTGDVPLSKHSRTFVAGTFFKCSVIFEKSGSGAFAAVSLAQERHSPTKSAMMSELQLKNTLTSRSALEIGDWQRILQCPVWMDAGKTEKFFAALVRRAADHFSVIESLPDDSLKENESYRFSYCLVGSGVLTTSTAPTLRDEQEAKDLARLTCYLIQYHQHDVLVLKPIIDRYETVEEFDFEEMLGDVSMNTYRKLRRPPKPEKKTLPPPQRLSATINGTGEPQDQPTAPSRSVFELPDYEELLHMSTKSTPVLPFTSNCSDDATIEDYVSEQATTYRSGCFLQGEDRGESCVDHLKLLSKSIEAGSAVHQAAVGNFGVYPKPEYIETHPYLNWSPLHCGRSPFAHSIRFAPGSSSLVQKTNWRTSGRLKEQSLVALVSTTRSQPILLWGVVVAPHSDMRGKGIVSLQFDDADEVRFDHLIQRKEPLVLLESHSMLFQSEPILRSLGEVRKYNENDPASIILSAIAKTKPQDISAPPAYASDDYTQFLPPDVVLDPEQHLSVQTAFSNKICCIQGPPGTGKSFTGTQLICCAARMLRNKSNAKSGPILVITFKNHSLEEILKDVRTADTTFDIIRIGGAFTDDPLLKEMQLNCRVRRSNRRHFVDTADALREYLTKKEELHTFNDVSAVRCAPPLQRDAILDPEDSVSEAIVAKWLEGAPNRSKAQAQTTKQTKSVKADDPDEQLNKELDDMEDSDVESEVDPDERDIGVSELKEVMHLYEGSAEPTMHLGPTLTEHPLLTENSQLEREWLVKLLSVTPDPWEWPKKSRRRAMEFWRQNAISGLSSEVDQLHETYEAEKKKQHHRELKDRIKALLKADVVGVTATSCAINLELIKAIQPRVLVVEEAAEILEVSTIACVAQKTEHIVLLGDHQQLRPNVECFEVQRRCNLRYSLFERLVANGFPHVSLKTQRRMHPDICKTISQFYERGVSNHEQVQRHGRQPFESSLNRLLKGERCMFWNHNTAESASEVGRSQINKTEAKMINTFVKVITQYAGVPPQSITVLSYYLGQVRYLRNTLANTLVNVRTVDSFQGDENDIVIVSLVRRDKATSHMKMQNRMIVALSRARLFSLVVGSTQLVEQFSHWKDALSVSTIASKLPVCCPNHVERTAELTPEANHVFCKEKCGFIFPSCKHRCTQPCHSLSPHVGLCQERVEVFPLDCTNPEHKISVFCGKQDEKQVCTKLVEHIRHCKCVCNVECRTKAQLQVFDSTSKEEELLGRCTNKKTVLNTVCGHEAVVECANSEEPRLSKALPKCKHLVSRQCPDCNEVFEVACHTSAKPFQCKQLVRVQLPGCGHEKEIRCYQRREQLKCEQEVSVRQPCGHTTALPCWNRSAVVRCQAVTPYTCSDCNHSVELRCFECLQPPPCSVLVPSAACPANPPHECACFERTKPCRAIVEGQMKCGHISRVECGSKKSVKPCMQKVKLQHDSCGHEYEVLCLQRTKAPPQCNKRCSKLLPCGKHTCQKLCKEPCEIVCTTCVKESTKKRLDELNSTIRQLEQPAASVLDPHSILSESELDICDIRSAVPTCFSDNPSSSLSFVFSPVRVFEQENREKLLRFGRWKKERLSAGEPTTLKFLFASSSKVPPENDTAEKSEFYFRSKIDANVEDVFTVYLCDLSSALTRENPQPLTTRQRERLKGKGKVSVHDPENGTYTFVNRDFRITCPFIPVCEVRVVGDQCLHRVTRDDQPRCIGCCAATPRSSSSISQKAKPTTHHHHADPHRQVEELSNKTVLVKVPTDKAFVKGLEYLVAGDWAEAVRALEAVNSASISTQRDALLSLALLDGEFHNEAAEKMMSCILANDNDEFVSLCSDLVDFSSFQNQQQRMSMQNKLAAVQTDSDDFSRFVRDRLSGKSSTSFDLLFEWKRLLNEFALPEVQFDEEQPKPTAAESFVFDGDALDAAPSLEDLNKLEGMMDVKREINGKVQEVLLSLQRQSVVKKGHWLFAGNPGTGKTTVARILVEIFMDLGLIDPEVSKDDDGPQQQLPPQYGMYVPGNPTIAKQPLTAPRVKFFTDTFNAAKNAQQVKQTLSEVKAYKKNNDRDQLEKMAKKLLRSKFKDPSATTNNSANFLETTGAKLLGMQLKDVEKLLEDHKNGVIFIDEAYQLSSVSGATGGQGQRVIDLLFPFMENNASTCCVILAGYRSQMDEFMRTNPGIKSRISQQVTFEDYTKAQLRNIFLGMLEAKEPKGEWRVDNERTVDIFSHNLAQKADTDGFGNARDVRNGLEKAISRQSTRLTETNATSTNRSAHVQLTLLRSDVCGVAPYERLTPTIAKLHNMVGLSNVKTSILGILKERLQTINDENNGSLVDNSQVYHRCFLGNPGTGKTTVARLYAKLLGGLGVCESDEFIETRPSDIKGDVIGASEKKMRDVLESASGKTLFIDEAYTLYDAVDPYTKQMVDTFIGLVHGTPKDRQVVLMAGYEHEMREMFTKSNPGLKRRMQLDRAFVLHDYSRSEMSIILHRKVNSLERTLSRVDGEAVVDHLVKLKQRPNFGNAGDINNLVSAALGRAKSRCQCDPSDDPKTLLVEDFDIEVTTAAEAAAFEESLERFPDLLKYRKGVLKKRKRDEKKGKPPSTERMCFVLKGNPGTGKSTASRLLGKMLLQMGLLSEGKMHEKSVKDLQTGYVGQAALKTNEVLTAARGGVLFIDEAYRLNEKGGVGFGKEMLDELCDAITKPEFEGKIAIALAGYPAEMDELLAANPGLASRFCDVIEMQDWSSEKCATFFLEKARDERQDVENTCTAASLASLFDEIRDKMAGWANARDVLNLFSECEKQIGLESSDDSDLDEEEDEIWTERQIRDVANELMRKRPQPKSKSQPPNEEQTLRFPTATATPPTPAPTRTNTKADHTASTMEVLEQEEPDDDDALVDTEDDIVGEKFGTMIQEILQRLNLSVEDVAAQLENGELPAEIEEALRRDGLPDEELEQMKKKYFAMKVKRRKLMKVRFCTVCGHRDCGFRPIEFDVEVDDN